MRVSHPAVWLVAATQEQFIFTLKNVDERLRLGEDRAERERESPEFGLDSTDDDNVHSG